METSPEMHGLIARFTAHPGKRDEVAALMVSGGTPPGCQSFVVANDPTDPDALWITEVWDSEDRLVAQSRQLARVPRR